jgi:gamma-glutamylputrescine oxidase
MAGLTCADVLAERGIAVLVLEQDYCGAGASGRSSGFVTPDSELELRDLVTRLGDTRGRQLWDFARGGVARIRGTIERLAIECDFQVQDSLFVASSDRDFRDVIAPEHREHSRHGEASTLYGPEALASVLGARGYRGGVRYDSTFAIDSYAFCRGLRDALERRGVRVHEGTRVLRITHEGVETPEGSVKAEAVALFTDRWLTDPVLAAAAVYHVQTFLAVSEPLRPEHLRAIFPTETMMVWDTDLVYQYFRATGDGRLLVGASDLRQTYARHETRFSPPVLRRMRRYLARQFPSVPIALERFWPGLLGISKDFLPVVGQASEHPRAYFAGAAAGLPWAAALGEYVANKIVQGRDELDDVFSPQRRFTIGSHLQRVLGKPLAFALSHAAAKYFRR